MQSIRKAAHILLILLAVVALGCGGEEKNENEAASPTAPQESSPLTGVWSGTLKDTVSSKTAAWLDAAAGIEITDERQRYYDSLIENYAITLRLAQDGGNISGSVEIEREGLYPISQGSFAGGLLIITYTESNLMTGLTKITLTGTLGSKRLKGEWGRRGNWEASKQP